MKTHLVFAIMTIALLTFVISQTGRRTLNFEDIIAQARQMSLQPFRPQPKVRSEALANLSYDQYRDIRWKDDYTLWRKKGLPFQVKFLLTARDHMQPVTVYQVNREGAGEVPFSPGFFDYGRLNDIPPEEAAKGGYAGFRVHYPVKRNDSLDEVLVFLGASYFRAVARDLEWGISARGIAIDTEGKEEFPAFTAFWLVEPSPGASELTFYALLDGKAIAGAYEFRVATGVETKMRVRAVLFPRRNIKGLGIAPLTSMYWFGENTSNTFGDFRPEVHDSDGLQILRSNDEWVWRPLTWSKQLQVNTFADANPRGFGLFQRDRDFTHYQDLEAKYHQRPGAWVEPEGEWGEGAIHLVQLPTDNEFMDNIVAFWQPEGGGRKEERMDFAYTITWFGENSGLPPMGRCLSTRIDYQEKPNYRFIVLEFAGGGLDGLAEQAKVEPDLWVGENGILSEVQVQKIPHTNSWRASFGVTASKPNVPIEMRCSLRLDGRPVTETWSYTW